jgi:type II secretory pathway pseudopilin PulG
MTAKYKESNKRKVVAFTLVEAMITSGIMAIFVAGCLSALVFNQVADRKAKEEAIVMNFISHYVETVKALPFTSVAPGQPISSLFNGVNGAPLITIPQDNSWVPLNTTAFYTFSPGLLWLNNRNPAMQVTLTDDNVNGTLQDIEINVKVDWDAPLGKGGRLEVQADFLRTVDSSTL